MSTLAQSTVDDVWRRTPGVKGYAIPKATLDQFVAVRELPNAKGFFCSNPHTSWRLASFTAGRNHFLVISRMFGLLSARLPVGLLWRPAKTVYLSHALITKHQKRISGPLLDRIDIHIEVPRADYERLSGDRVGEPSECIRARVQAARNIQSKRFSHNGSSDIVCNADMRVGEIWRYCKLLDEGQSLMRAATPCCA